MKTEIILLCHATTHAMKTGSFPSPGDAIDELELARLPHLASMFQPDRVVTSPAHAAMQTGRAFETTTSVDASWSDLDYGLWQGRPIREIHDEDAAGLGAWLSEPGSAAHGGESLEALQTRVWGALESNREAGVTLIVTHAIVVKTVLARVLEAPLTAIYCMDLEPLSAITLTRSGEAWRLRCKSSV
ncbi:histidine phosphatase family protein [Caballeronia sp. LjRoot34]|uniref:histidine phosphatase family protein n=1 Tax=Caballeronia sp. LjRoot34 TaxID=3342325 RepID=UPI003ECC7306